MQNRSNLAAEREVGFQLIDKNDEGDWAVGVFGIRTGTKLSYVPCFFIDGEVKVEHLYIPDRDQFCPLSDKWVSAIEKFGQNPLGRGISRTESLKNPSYSDLTPFAFPQFKSAAVSREDREDFRRAATDVQGFLTRVIPEYQPPPLPERIKAAGLAGVRAFVKSAQTVPGFASAVQKVYPNLCGELAEMVENTKPETPVKRATVAKRASGPTGVTGRYLTFSKVAGRLVNLGPEGRGTALIQYAPFIAKLAAERKKRGPKGPLESFFDAQKPNDPDKGVIVPLKPRPSLFRTKDALAMRKNPLFAGDGLEKVAADVARDGHSVEDSRDDMAYVIQEEIRLKNPAGAGIYSVLADDGTYKDMLVLTPIVTSGRVEPGRCMVLSTRNPAGEEAPWTGPVKDVVVRDDQTPDEAEKKLKDWLEKKQKAPKKLQNYTNYLFVDARGHCTELLQINDGPTRSGHYSVSPRRESTEKTKTVSDESALFSRMYANVDRKDHRVHEDECLELTGEAGRGLVIVDGEIKVPTTAIALKFDGYLDSKLRSKGLGNRQDLQKVLFGKSASLELTRTGTDSWSINGFPVSGSDAFEHLLVDWDLSAEDAGEVLKSAAARGNARTLFHVIPSVAFVKAAIAPAFPQERVGVENGYRTSVPAQYPVDEISRNPSYPARRTDYYGDESMTPGFGNRDSSSLGMSAEAGPGVFDTSAFSTMLRNTNEKRMIDEGIPDLYRGMNRTGAYLFALYAHPDQLEDRYGDQDLKTFEDTLRTTFEQEGDVILFLRQTDANPFPDGSPSQLDI